LAGSGGSQLIVVLTNSEMDGLDLKCRHQSQFGDLPDNGQVPTADLGTKAIKPPRSHVATRSHVPRHRALQRLLTNLYPFVARRNGLGGVGEATNEDTNRRSTPIDSTLYTPRTGSSGQILPDLATSGA
jgi:hypothetical protein